MKRIGARCSSETARSRSLPWVARAPANGGSRRTSFVSRPEKNRARLLRGVALRKKRGAEKPGLEYALGGRAAKASLRQMIGPGCFDACKEEFNEEAVARHSACMSCHGNLGINCHRQRNIPKTYGWATPRQVRRRGADV